MDQGGAGTDLVEAPARLDQGRRCRQPPFTQVREASAPAARRPRLSPRSARPGLSATGRVARERPTGRSGPATTAGCRRAPRGLRATVSVLVSQFGGTESRISIHPWASSTAITSGTRCGIGSASACVATASCRNASALHLKKTSSCPTKPAGRPTGPKAGAAVVRRRRVGRLPPSGRRSRSRRGPTIRGGTTAGRSGDQPSARSRAHQATAAREVFGSSRAITFASRSCQAQPAGGSTEVASNSTMNVTSPCSRSSPSSASVAEVITRRRAAAVAVSTTSTQARISGKARLCAAHAQGGAASSGVEGSDGESASADQDSSAPRIRYQQAHLAALSQPKIGHVQSLTWIPARTRSAGRQRSKTIAKATRYGPVWAMSDDAKTAWRPSRHPARRCTIPRRLRLGACD